MKIAYLLASYPMTSTTFIRREIEAIEALGQPIERFSIRTWDTALVDPGDLAEQARTRYILTGGKGALVADALAALISHLPRFLTRFLPLWWQLYRNAGTNFVQHGAYLVEALAFRRRTAALGIDHVHVHFSTNAAAVAMLSHEIGGPGYSFMVHGPDELVDPASTSLGEKVRRSAATLAITDYCRARILQFAPGQEEKVAIVRCGIDLDDYAYDGAAPDNGRLICIGRLCANKGQIHIPAAVAQVAGEFPDISVILIGGGDDEPAIRAEIAKHGVERHVILHGWGTGEQVKAALRDGRALLLPSYAEGLPIVIMEALAIGRPVLSTMITGIPELVDDGCGWLFAPGDVDAIAQALRAVMQASAAERAALGAEGRRRVEERHDLRKQARTLLAMFRGIVGRTPRI